MPTTVKAALINDLQNVQKTVNTLHQNLQQSPPVSQIQLSNSAGQLVASLGQFQFQGVNWTNWLSELHCGSPLNCNTPSDPNNAIFNANTDGSVSIGNSGWIDVHDPFSGNAAWIGTQFDSLVIENAVNNGSGLIRLTVKNHTLATGNICAVRNMNLVNVQNAVGLTWTVTVIDANTVDLQNSVWSGPYIPIADPPNGLTTYQPTIDRVLQISGVTSATGLFRITTAVAHGYESGTAVNIPAPGPMGNPTTVGQWVISIPATLPVTAAVDNGSGLIRVTVTGGNYKTGDKVQFLNIRGVPNANGWFTVTAISAGVVDLQGSTFAGAYAGSGTATFTNANFFDLVGSTFRGSYVSGGTVLQYFAGVLAETMAIGPSFQNYNLRAFPSGDLRINNATIQLKSGAGTILLNPVTSQIVLSSLTTLAGITLDATVPSLTFFSQNGSPDVTLEILSETPLAVTSASNASPVVMTVPGCISANPTGFPYLNGDTVLIAGATGNTAINGYRIVENASVHGTDTFTMTDLQGNVINGNGAAAGTVTCQRYYAGMLAQSLALGASWSGYRLRFFADGELLINRASIDQSAITNSTFAGSITGSVTSVGGTAPNTITLTINNGLLNIIGAGTATGSGNIVIDGNMKAASYNVGATAGADGTVSISGLTLNFSKGIFTSQSGSFGTTGFTGTATVRNAAGTGTSSFVFANGLCSSYTP